MARRYGAPVIFCGWLLLLTACSKKYECVCTHPKGISSTVRVEANTPLSARNECDAMEDTYKGYDCELN